MASLVGHLAEISSGGAMVARAFLLLAVLAEALAKSCTPNKAGTPALHCFPRQGTRRLHPAVVLAPQKESGKGKMPSGGGTEDPSDNQPTPEGSKNVGNEPNDLQIPRYLFPFPCDTSTSLCLTTRCMLCVFKQYFL